MNSKESTDSKSRMEESSKKTVSRRDWLMTMLASGVGVSIGTRTVSKRAQAAGPGDQKWAFETGLGVNSPPTVADGTVYVGSNDFNLYAVDAGSGNQEWAFETGAFVSWSSPTVADGTVYVGSSDTNLYAVNMATGDQKWAFETGGGVDSSPTVADGTVYVGSDDNLYAVDATTGEQQWIFQTGDYVHSSPTVADGTVYVGSHDGNLYAVDAVSGDQKWVFETGDDVDSSPTVADGIVYVGSDDKNLYAVDAVSGDQEWTFETGSEVNSSPTVANGTVYVGSDDKNLYAVDAGSGDQEWAFETGGRVWSSPTVADGTVYVGSNDENLYAVGTDHTKSSSGSRARLETLGHHVQSPTARFSVTPAQPETGTTVTFDASDSSDKAEVTQYQWDFTGDGAVDATGQQPTHTYTTAGNYTVRLTVTDRDGRTASVTRTVSVSEPQVTGADTFSYTPSAPTVESPVTFEANNFPPDGTATSYEWDFTGDGATDAFGSTVRHIFSSGGTQTVTLTAELESGEAETIRRSVLVNGPPQPGFRISPSPAIIEEPTTFDASETTDSTGSIESYEWDFDGDGTIDKTGRAVTHTFAEEGRPTVTLRATDSQGLTATQSRSVSVQRAAEFSFQLRDTTITRDGETTATIGVNSLLGSERLFTQLSLSVPSGWNVSFVDAGSASSTTATEIFETEPGQTRTVEVKLSPNDTGEFRVSGRAFYFVGDRSPPRHTRQLSSGTLTVTGGETTSESTAPPSDDPPATASDEAAQRGTETSTGMPGLGVGAGVTALGGGVGLLKVLDSLGNTDDSEKSDTQ